jgi:DNA polymerase-4
VTSADQAYHQLNTEIFTQLLTKAYQRGVQQPVRLLGLGVGIKNQPEHNLQLSILD